MISNSPPLTQELNTGSVKWLSGVTLDIIYSSFLSAFSQYPIAFNLNKEQFRDKFYTRLKMSKNLSPGFLYDEKLYAFIFTSIREWDGISIAYNGGTGVIPEGRDHGLIYKLYEKLLPKLESQNIRFSLLEVLENNERALHVYSKCGFTKNRFLESFQLSPFDLNYRELDENIEIREGSELSMNTNWWDTDPGFLEKYFAPEFDRVFCAIFNNMTIGYIIFNPGNGRISQLAVDPNYRRNGIGSNLIRTAYNYSSVKKLSAINIESANESVKALLKFAGFTPYINQFEMVLSF